MGLIDYLDDRLGIRQFWRESMTGKHPPQGIGFLRTLGFAAMTVMLLQFLSGIGLAFHYVPSADQAYDSIRAFEQDVPFGRFTRSLHHFGASAFVIFVFLHMCRVFFTGAYKKPRELTWFTGVGLFAIVLGFGFTGYLLPWDQKAYFATKVGTEIASKAPILGEHVKEILNGGEEVGPPTLSRFYVIHVVLLPLGLLALLGLHMFLIQRHSVSPPGVPVDQDYPKGPPYHPHHTFKEALVGAVVAAGLFALSASFDAPLEDLAEPSDTQYQPRPDWYFFGLFELLKYFKGDLEVVGAFWIPTIFGGLLVMLPFLDRTKQRDWRKRPIATAIGAFSVIAIIALTALGMSDQPENKRALPYPLGLTSAQKQGYVMLRRLKCIECHALTYEGTNWGNTNEDAVGDLANLDMENMAPTVADGLANPAEIFGTEEMPSFAQVSYEDRIAVGLYLQWLQKHAKKPATPPQNPR